MPDPRPTWDAYFLSFANLASTRADCTRAQHGAVIVRDNRIVSVGYNGAPSGDSGCLTQNACPRGRKSYEEVPSLSGDYSDCIAVHAEANAIVYAGQSCKGATIYITGEPCSGCVKLIRAAGIERVVYPNV